MMNSKFDKIYSEIISEGALSIFKKDDKVEKVIKNATSYVVKFNDFLNYLTKNNVNPKFLNKFISEDKRALITKLTTALKSENFKKEIVKNEKVKKGVDIIINKFNEVWPKLKKLNFFRGKIKTDDLKEDAQTILSVLPDCAEILVQIFSVISKLFTFLSSEFTAQLDNPKNITIDVTPEA